MCGTGDIYQDIADAGHSVRRSGRQPLELRLSANGGRIQLSDYAHLSIALAEFLPRVETLLIQIWGARSFEECFPLYLRLPALRAMVLSYEYSEIASDCPYADHHPDFELVPGSIPHILIHPTPALESFTVGSSLSGGIDTFDYHAISSLTSLRYLNLVGGAFNLDATFEILTALPHLEVIACDVYHFDERPTSALTSLTFPNLKSLYLEGLGATVFRDLEAPQLEVLYLDQVVMGSEDFNAFRETLKARERFPMLYRLSMKDHDGGRPPMETLVTPGLTELVHCMVSDQQCGELFDGLRVAHTLHTLVLSPITLYREFEAWSDSHIDPDPVINPEVIASSLAGFIEWRRTSPKPLPLRIVFGIHRGVIPSLASFCDSIEDDDSLSFSFSIPLYDVRLSQWWRENTDF